MSVEVSYIHFDLFIHDYFAIHLLLYHRLSSTKMLFINSII